jgi:hypothetical protein
MHAPDAPGDTITLERWIEALGRFSREPEGPPWLASLPAEEATELLGDLRDWLRWRLPARAPHTFEEQAAWLGRIETLDLALRGARALGDSVSWTTPLVSLLEESLAERRSAVEQMPRPWWHARTALVQRTDLELPDARPWLWLPSLAERGGLDRLTEEDRRDVVRAWAAGALPDEDEAALRQAVVEHPAWKQVYQGWLHEHLGEVWIERLAVHLEIPRQLTLLRRSLPHLGRGKGLRVRLLAEGTCWELPDHALSIPYGTPAVKLPLGAVGDLSVTLHEQELDEEQQAARVLLTARHFLDELEDQQALAMALRLTDWLQGKLPHLARAAQAFRDNDEGGLDDFWPRHLAELRARLEQAADILGDERALGAEATPLRDELRKLDRSARPHHEALGLIDEDFWQGLDEIFGTPPPGAWWAPLEEPPLALWEQLARPAPRRFPRVSPPQLAMAAAFGEPNKVPQEHLIQWRSPEGWEADLNLPAEATADTMLVIRFLDLPEEATHAVLAGLELPITRPQDDAPQVRCTVEVFREATRDAEDWADSIRVRVGEKSSTGNRSA